MPIKLQIKKKYRIRYFKWIQLILSGCVTVILGGFTIIYPLQKDALDQASHRQTMNAARIVREQMVYDGYIDDISTRLLHLNKRMSKRRETWEELRHYLRLKTLNAFASS